MLGSLFENIVKGKIFCILEMSSVRINYQQNTRGINNASVERSGKTACSCSTYLTGYEMSLIHLMKYKSFNIHTDPQTL